MPLQPYQQRRVQRLEEERTQTRRIAQVQARHNKLDAALAKWAGTPVEPEKKEYDLDSLEVQTVRP